MAVKRNSSNELSYDTKTIIVVLTLLMFFPVGVILMFKWMKWPKWVKTVVLLPVFLAILAMIATIAFVIINPKGLVEKGMCAAKCEDSINEEMCLKDCFSESKESTESAY